MLLATCICMEKLLKADPILGKLLISKQNPRQLKTNILLQAFLRSPPVFWDSISLHIGNVNGLVPSKYCCFFPKESSCPYALLHCPCLMFSQMEYINSSLPFCDSLVIFHWLIKKDILSAIIYLMKFGFSTALKGFHNLEII